MKRRLLCFCALVAEPCVHVFAALTGVHLPHPEGLNALAATYLANNPEA